MKKILLLLTVLILTYFSGLSQYPGNGNDWIDYSKTYYKFKINEEGIYKITAETLLSKGTSSSELVGKDFALFHNGQEIPIYVSTPDLFSTTDFIEFYGKLNDGKTDTPLYEEKNQQASTQNSFFEDAGTYFLVLKPNTVHKRITSTQNNLSDLPAKEEFFMHQATNKDHQKLVYAGQGIVLAGTIINFSEYGNSESVITRYNSARYETNIPTPFVAENSGKNATLNTTFSNYTRYNSTDTFTANFNINNQSIDKKDFKILVDYQKSSSTFDPSLLKETTRVKIDENFKSWLFMNEITIDYPRTFDFSTDSFFKISYDETGSKYFEFSNIKTTDRKNVAFYDLNLNYRYDLTYEENIKLKTSSDSQNNIVFDSEIVSITDLEKVTMSNFDEKVDLLIIYASEFNQELNGTNYLEKLIQHKQSNAGDNLSVAKINIEDLYNQFSFGIDGHNAVVRNFIQELKQNDKLPKNVLLIGKGISYNYIVKKPELREKNQVPTFGHPASDNMLVMDYFNTRLLCAIGRISVKTNEEFSNVVNKIIDYQTAQKETQDSDQTKEKLWMKQGVHLGGGKSAGEQFQFKNYLDYYKTIFEDKQYGGSITSIYKNSTDAIQDANSAVLDSLINNGVSLLTFFGHAAPTAIDFNLRDPKVYTNTDKYMFILSNGCYVGDLYLENESFSEKFVLEKDKGAIGFIGPTLYGISPGLNLFSTGFYKDLSRLNYGGTVGEHIMNSMNNDSSIGLISTITKQQMVYNGDPTIRLNPHKKQDYLITAEDLKFTPSVISSNDDTFDVNVTISNIGKAVDEEVLVRLTRELPNGETEVFDKIVQNIYYQKEVKFTLTTNAVKNQGINKFSVTIDPDKSLDEITHANNALGTPITKQISSSNVTPVSPFEFAITNKNEIELKASSVNFYSSMKNFKVEIDTTELFNSSLLKSTSISSLGGTIKWKPSIDFQNEQVYYWRAKLDEENQQWQTSSFIHLDAYETGWNQSHYYQFKKNKFDDFEIGENKKFQFGERQRSLTVRSGNVKYHSVRSIAYYIDNLQQARYEYCGDFAAVLIDPTTGKALKNKRVGSNAPVATGLYNSIICYQFDKLFLYDVKDQEKRKNFMDFLDVIPEGMHVLIYSQRALKPSEYKWDEDTQAFGYNLFDKLKENGATQAEQISEEGPYVFYFKKGDNDFKHKFEKTLTEPEGLIDQSLVLPAVWNRGNMISKTIGPAKTWKQFEWKYDHSLDDKEEGDKITYSITGIDINGVEKEFFVQQNAQSLDISSINAKEYPYLKLNTYFEDKENYTPAQLNYWRVIYEKIPELAIDVRNVYKQYPLKLSLKEKRTIQYSIENISDVDFEPVLVRYTFTDAKGKTTIKEKRYSAIPKGKSIDIELQLNDEIPAEVGVNSVLIDVNPDNDQLEQNHFNNIANINYELSGDNQNPLLDVTFDGIHIIDGDLIQDEPSVVISVTDENKFLLLDDPNSFEIVLTHPDDKKVTYTAESPEVKFYPAKEENENKAVIEFNPKLSAGTYTMTVQAKDKSGNLAGDNQYIINFKVTEEDIVTQVVNYPNPFTTRTEFVANIIGDAPDQVLIQIFAPTGAVVKEIQTTPSEITRSSGNRYYKLAEWDGTDNYGDPIGNGAYFYKVTMKRGGKVIESNKGAGSEHFHNGIGKLYILR